MTVSIPYEPFDINTRDKTQVGKPAWCFVIDGDWSVANKVCIYLRCPNCCCPSQLFAHEISQTGQVNPSIWHQCPSSLRDQIPADDWHIYGILEEWTDLIGATKSKSVDLDLFETKLNPNIPEKADGQSG